MERGPDRGGLGGTSGDWEMSPRRGHVSRRGVGGLRSACGQGDLGVEGCFAKMSQEDLYSSWMLLVCHAVARSHPE